jgi:ribosomal protein S27AE
MVPVSLLLTTPPISAMARRPLTSCSMVESGEDAIMAVWIDNWRCGHCTIQKTSKVPETGNVKAEEIGSGIDSNRRGYG